MKESYNIDEIVAVKGPAGISQGENALVEDIEKALAEMGAAKESADAAKAELNRLIADKLHDGADPFVAMLDAMLYVIPQLMKYKEEKLVEKTASFEYINSLNAYMAETQKNFAASADAGVAHDARNEAGDFQYGETTGLASGRAYEANLLTLGSKDLFAGLPGEVQDVMNGSVSTTLGLKGSTPDAGEWVKEDLAIYGKTPKTSYNLSETLWGGLNAPQWRMGAGSEGEYDNNLYNTNPYGQISPQEFDYFAQGSEHDGSMVGNQTEASYLMGQLAPVVDEAVTQNAVMLSTLNGYSKKVESEFKFEMENYNTIVSLNGLMYSDQINLNNTHITRLRAK